MRKSMQLVVNRCSICCKSVNIDVVVTCVQDFFYASVDLC